MSTKVSQIEQLEEYVPTRNSKWAHRGHRHRDSNFRRRPNGLKRTPADRLFWVWLRRAGGDWKSARRIVPAETVIAWHRKGFRLFWRWKIQRGKPGRPRVSQEIRDLIRTISRSNPRWGAPEIHGELLKVDFEITEPTASKCMVRQRKPPAQTWRTFLNNHAQSLVSIDFFTVPTPRFQILYVFLVVAHDRRRILHCGGRLIRRPQGPHTSSGRRFRGTAHRGICGGIGTRSSVTSL